MPPLGVIEEIHGPVIDVRCDRLPPLHQALFVCIDGERCVLEVHRHLDEFRARAIALHRTGGLLELAFPNGSKIVVNTQPPLQELWLASRAAGQHFRHVDGRWLDTRDGSEFFEALSRQASAQGARALTFVPA